VFLKLAGIGLVTPVFVDATVVRMVLMSATMELLGDRNSWLPCWIDRVLPRLGVEAEATATGPTAPPEPEPQPVSGAQPHLQVWNRFHRQGASSLGPKRAEQAVPPRQRPEESGPALPSGG
jgi:hypothetical protein